jgi:hypothetical protein
MAVTYGMFGLLFIVRAIDRIRGSAFFRRHLTGSAGGLSDRPGGHMYRLSVAIWCIAGPNIRCYANVLS